MTRSTPKAPLPGRTVRAKRTKKATSAAVPETPSEYKLDDEEEVDEPEIEEVSEGRSDPLTRYFHEIEHGEPLLNAKEEIELAKGMMDRVVVLICKKLSQYERYVKKTKRSTPKRNFAKGFLKDFNPRKLKVTGKLLKKRLVDLMYGEDGHDAYEHFIALDAQATAYRERMTQANLRLVVNIAKRYSQGSMKLPDLIQEGNLGLAHAVPRYDYRKGWRFSTYATWWIRHAIGRAMSDKAREIRIPVHMLEFASNARKVRAALAHRLGRPATHEEVAKTMRVPVGKLVDIGKHFVTMTSLDRPVLGSDGDGDDLHEFVPVAAEEPDPWATIVEGRASDLLKDALMILTPIERNIIERRFGITSKTDEEQTFREIGDEYDLSRERIRQLQSQALAKLRRRLAKPLDKAAA